MTKPGHPEQLRAGFATLTQQVYFPTATLDDRFLWEEITPANAAQQTDEIRDQLKALDITRDEAHGPRRWTDMKRYRISGCAHLVTEGGYCHTCGEIQ